MSTPNLTPTDLAALALFIRLGWQFRNGADYRGYVARVSTLRKLIRLGLMESNDRDFFGSTLYRITPAGNDYADAHRAEIEAAVKGLLAQRSARAKARRDARAATPGPRRQGRSAEAARRSAERERLAAALQTFPVMF